MPFSPFYALNLSREKGKRARRASQRMFRIFCDWLSKSDDLIGRLFFSVSYDYSRNYTPQSRAMLVEYFNTPQITGSILDKKLADGWFRSGQLLFRSQIICIDTEVNTVVNIRLPLEGYSMPKRMRKIFRRNQRKFRYEVGPFRVDADAERLYQYQRERFVGFLYNSLMDLFVEAKKGGTPSPFDTRMIRVYDRETDRLVAASIFDVGNNSVASILGMFDPDYGKYSLGTYTMLLEVALAQKQSRSFYYPGYVLDQPSIFDYKLKLGKDQMEYYDWKGSWRPWSFFNPETSMGQYLRKLLQQMEDTLRLAEVPFQRQVYIAFPAGYFPGMEGSLRCPVFFSCPDEDSNTIIAYIWEEQRFALMKTERLVLLEVAGIEISPDWKNNPEYCINLLDIVEVIAKGNPHEIVQAYRNYICRPYR